MEKHKLKKICEELNLYNQIIPYSSDEGVLFVNSNTILNYPHLANA
ncbi:hypothetical protein [Domibacillus mangrovi]|nr:hypothetical protein [Domibacillus mangrovi]